MKILLDERRMQVRILLGQIYLWLDWKVKGKSTTAMSISFHDV